MDPEYAQAKIKDHFAAAEVERQEDLKKKAGLPPTPESESIANRSWDFVKNHKLMTGELVAGAGICLIWPAAIPFVLEQATGIAASDLTEKLVDFALPNHGVIKFLSSFMAGVVATAYGNPSGLIELFSTVGEEKAAQIAELVASKKAGAVEEVAAKGTDELKQMFSNFVQHVPAESTKVQSVRNAIEQRFGTRFMNAVDTFLQDHLTKVGDDTEKVAQGIKPEEVEEFFNKHYSSLKQGIDDIFEKAGVNVPASVEQHFGEESQKFVDLAHENIDQPEKIKQALIDKYGKGFYTKFEKFAEKFHEGEAPTGDEPDLAEQLHTFFGQHAKSLKGGMKELAEKGGVDLTKAAKIAFKKDLETFTKQVATLDGSGTLAELAAKADRLVDNIRWGALPVEAMYDAQLFKPRILFTKAIADAINLPVQIVWRSLGTSMKYGASAGIDNLTAGFSAYRDAFGMAMKYAYASFRGDQAIASKLLELDKDIGADEVIGAVEQQFNNSPTAYSWRWINALKSKRDAFEAGKYLYGTGRRATMAADQFSKAMSYVANKLQASHLMALNEATELELVGAARTMYAEARAADIFSEVGTAASEAVGKRARTKAFQDTFTDQGAVTKYITKQLDKSPGIMGLKPFRFLVPYFTTPVDIAKEGAYFGPFAPVSGSGFWRDFNQKDFSDGVDRAIAIAKWATGTQLWSHIFDWVAKGHLVGDPPTGALRYVDPDRDHPRSFKFHGQYYSYAHTGAIGDTLAAAADAAYIYNHSDDPLIHDHLAAVIGGMLASKAEQDPFLEGIGNMIHAIDSFKEAANADQPGALPKAATEFFGSLVTGFIPGFVRDIAHAQDPKVRHAQTVLGIVKQNIPGWSDHEQSKPYDYAERDHFGHFKYLPMGAGPGAGSSAIDRFLNSQNPFTHEGPLDVDDVDAELFRHGVKSRPFDDFFTYGSGKYKVNIPLTPNEKDSWERNAGHELIYDGKNQHDYMEQMIKSPLWGQMSFTDQKNQLETIRNQFRSNALTQLKSTISANDPRIQDANKKIQQLQQPDMPQPTFTPGATPTGPAGENTSPIAVDPKTGMLTMPVTVSRKNVPAVNLPVDPGDVPLGSR